MIAKVKTIVAYMEELAPSSIALPGDPVGLQVGSFEAEVGKILVALDPDLRAVEKATALGAEMLITHHPLIYNKLSSINEENPKGYLISKAIRNNLNIFSAHTNYDVARDGVSYQMAAALGLNVENAKILEVTGSEQLLKLVVFVPVGYEEGMRRALAGAGAGQIGRYSHCTFQVEGTGTFMPSEGTNPFIGTSGELEKVAELKLETILPATRRRAVINALLKEHPYEEAAYDLYPLDLDGEEIGLGLIIELDEEISIEQLLVKCSDRLHANIRYWSGSKKGFKRIALCGGSGGSLIEHAARQKAEILIAGDFRYHDLKDAEAYGLALIDAGHDASEEPGVAHLKQYLAQKLKTDGFGAEVILQDPAPTKWSQVEGR